jgi:hypothetical protein
VVIIVEAKKLKQALVQAMAPLIFLDSLSPHPPRQDDVAKALRQMQQAGIVGIQPVFSFPTVRFRTLGLPPQYRCQAAWSGGRLVCPMAPS